MWSDAETYAKVWRLTDTLRNGFSPIKRLGILEGSRLSKAVFRAGGDVTQWQGPEFKLKYIKKLKKKMTG
jgi:hypothetical protein